MPVRYIVTLALTSPGILGISGGRAVSRDILGEQIVVERQRWEEGMVRGLSLEDEPRAALQQNHLPPRFRQSPELREPGSLPVASPRWRVIMELFFQTFRDNSTCLAVFL